MAGWGLVGSATANAPLDTLEELIAGQAMKDEAMRKQAIEQRKLSQDDQRIGIDAQRAGFEGQRVGLDRDKFVDTTSQRTQQQQRLQGLMDTASKDPKTQYLVPVYQAALAGLSTTPVNADTFEMSPTEKHDRSVNDAQAKATAEAATRATEAATGHGYKMTQDAANDARRAANDAANDARDAAKPPKAASIPSNVKMKMADMNTIAKMVNDVDTFGDKNNWKGVGGMRKGGLLGFFSKEVGAGTPEESELRSKIGNIKGTIAKLRGGAAFTPSEMEMLETYTPTINDHPSLIKSKLVGLRQWLKFQDESIREQFGATPTGQSSVGDGPKLNERRTSNGETREWNGSEWILVK